MGRKRFGNQRNNYKLCKDFNISTSLVRVGLGGKGVDHNCSFEVERFSFNRVEGNFFHVCTDGNALSWMFKDDTDFIGGVNRVGICSHLTGAKPVHYTLMDNHVHFLLMGDIPTCGEFINRYKHLTGRWISSRHKIEGHMRGLPTSIIPIRDEESLLTVMAYIDRNPIVAGYRYLPSEYPWGSARYLFKECTTNNGAEKTLGSMSLRSRRLLLGSKVELPCNWTVNHSGMINPLWFWDKEFAESLFRTPSRYMYFLSKKLEGEIDLAISGGNGTFIPDKDLRPVITSIAGEMFGKLDIRTLNISSRMQLARKLRYEYGASYKQISRMLHLNPDVLKGFI